jgi:hypothetical protein
MYTVYDRIFGDFPAKNTVHIYMVLASSTGGIRGYSPFPLIFLVSTLFDLVAGFSQDSNQMPFKKKKSVVSLPLLTGNACAMFACRRRTA